VQNQRSMLVLVGDYGKDQVPNLHQILAQVLPPHVKRPSVLWCYKKELGFSSHKKKRMKKLKRDKQRGLNNLGGGAANNASSADNFELFVGQTDITWCYYKDTHRVLGTTHGLLVLQDFEALTPNLLARTIETVQGGGLVVVLMRTVNSLKQLYAMSMDVHSRYRTESAGDVVPRFNERFMLSLGKNESCLVCDDEMNVLPLSRRALKSLSSPTASSSSSNGDKKNGVDETEKEQQMLKELQESLIDTPHVGVLVELAKTLDQAKAVLAFLEACSDKSSMAGSAATISTTVAMTAARGRGKSAAMGLCLAGAVSLGYSTIAVTAPAPENLVSVFQFCLRGLQALKYQEHFDYSVAYNTAAGREQTKCVVAIRLHRTHRQVIQYFAPAEKDKFASAEIVAIDEAAAIPLPMVRALVQQQQGSSSNGDRISFLSSTVNGYEGTGRALSLKLIKELREAKGGKRHAELQTANTAASSIAGAKSNKGGAKVHEQRWHAAAEAVEAGSTKNEKLLGAFRELELSSPIRYAAGDRVETWLNKLLCLDCGSSSSFKLSGGAPAPADCELYSVDRDALFSYHKLSEAFLQKLMGLYTSAHYKNTPNDLQMLSDAPAHSVFVLLSPSAEQDSNSLPDILAVVQVALEGRISRKAVEAQLARGHRSAGDLIPWTISQQFGDSKFAQLSGARVVRIAVHPSVQGMGYGSRALELLYRFYNGEMVSLSNEDGIDDEDESDDEQNIQDESSDEDAENGNSADDGIRGETIKPRKDLPPLLLPLTEVEAPQLDWIGTSFGLTPELHKFWSRAGMRMLYLRQTKNELTGEHSAIMARALPKRTGFDDKWLVSFLGDFRRRFISLLGGAFRDLELRLAVSVLEYMTDLPLSSGRGTSLGAAAKITADELDYFLTPHDLRRLELYGRNLCDHHLVTDILPTVCRLYFTGRFGPESEFRLTSVQGGLLCGVGLQNRTIDSIASELGLPANQVLAMFNKAIRKISIALNGIVEQREKKALLAGEKREVAERAAAKMRDVAFQTLEEDAEEAGIEARNTLKANEADSLPPEISKDPELMRYVVKGTDSQWKEALEGKDVDSTSGTAVQIQNVRDKSRPLEPAEIEYEIAEDKQTKDLAAKKRGKKSKKRKSRN